MMTLNLQDFLCYMKIFYTWLFLTLGIIFLLFWTFLTIILNILPMYLGSEIVMQFMVVESQIHNTFIDTGSALFILRENNLTTSYKENDLILSVIGKPYDDNNLGEINIGLIISPQDGTNENESFYVNFFVEAEYDEFDKLGISSYRRSRRLITRKDIYGKIIFIVPSIICHIGLFPYAVFRTIEGYIFSFI